MSTCNIVGNHMSWLKLQFRIQLSSKFVYQHNYMGQHEIWVHKAYAQKLSLNSHANISRRGGGRVKGLFSSKFIISTKSQERLGRCLDLP